MIVASCRVSRSAALRSPSRYSATREVMSTSSRTRRRTRPTSASLRPGACSWWLVGCLTRVTVAAYRDCVSTVAALAVWVVLVPAWMTLRAGPGREGRRGSTAAGMITWVFVAAASLVQLTVAPGLLAAGRRDAAAIGEGEVWRLLTALVLQDGGWAGCAFNLGILAVTLVLVRRWLRARAWLPLLVGGGVVAGLATLATGGLDGAGCSMAVIVLVLGALGRVPDRAALPALGIALAAAAVLLIARDQHGLAVVLGVLAAGGLRAADWWQGGGTDARVPTCDRPGGRGHASA